MHREAPEEKGLSPGAAARRTTGDRGGQKEEATEMEVVAEVVATERVEVATKAVEGQQSWMRAQKE